MIPTCLATNTKKKTKNTVRVIKTKMCLVSSETQYKTTQTFQTSICYQYFCVLSKCGALFYRSMITYVYFQLIDKRRVSVQLLFIC